ncbi:vegetative incompatibility protein HET-E-1 [Naviculisporaceae sp. PSN 640]
MRLINAVTLEFEEFLDPSSVQYAILSHTWEAEEVTFSDMTNWKPSVKKKAGFIKIRETCRLARQRKLKYVWIDTCCIDKTSSAELSEAINSMFNWYAQSHVCFAHLSDLRPGSLGLTTKDLENCRWLRRGWTLQELIAPETLELYDAEWTLRGTKHQCWQAIGAVAGITKDGILNFKKVLESDVGPGFPVAQRMYWASRRETTRPEDMAYCLFGLFDVNMPLLYGEGGKKAFMRLQSAILEVTQDLSMLAWKLPAATTQTVGSSRTGMMARLPGTGSHVSGARGVGLTLQTSPRYWALSWMVYTLVKPTYTKPCFMWATLP